MKLNKDSAKVFIKSLIGSKGKHLEIFIEELKTEKDLLLDIELEK